MPTLDDILKQQSAYGYPQAPQTTAPAAPTSAAPTPSPLSLTATSSAAAPAPAPGGFGAMGAGEGNPGHDCAPDERWSAAQQQCIPRDGTSGVPAPGGGTGSCPEGQVWRADTNRCEAPDARSAAGQETCTGAQPSCPPGQGVWCDFDTATWKCAPNQFSDDELCRVKNKQRAAQGKPPLPCGGGAGGGAKKAPGAGGSGSAIGPGADSSLLGTDLEKYIRELLGSPSRYSDSVMQALYGENARQASGAITRGERSVRADAARRGMSRAGSTGAAILAVHNAAEQARGQADVGVMTAKLNADYQDKMGAIDRAQKYLDSLRDNEYRYTLLGEQRRQFDANLALAYANLAQQKSMLQMQLQSAWDMLVANQGFGNLGQGV